jgi:hypothetical protein
MVNALFRKQKSLYFRGLRIKKDPALASLKALMQGLFVYVGGLAILPLFRINGSAPRHSILDLVKLIIATSRSNRKSKKQNTTPTCTFNNENKSP